MTAEIISRDDAVLHLRIDGNDSDEWLALWIPIVQDAIIAWLKDERRIYQLDENGVPILDANGNPSIRPAVRGAALVELAHQYAYREGRAENRPASVYGHTLCAGATALLEPFRKPTLR